MNEQLHEDQEINIHKDPMLQLDDDDSKIRNRSENKKSQKEQKEQKSKERINFFIRTWTPQPTINSTAFCFFFFGVVFLVLGFIIYKVNSGIIERTISYDDKCKKIPQNGICNVNITLTEDMVPPVFVYYQMSNFYQNHRRYYQSRNTEQLAGKKISGDKLQRDCYPVIWLSDVEEVLNQTQLERMWTYGNKTNLTWGDIPAYPCGLMAKSFFNDTYNLTNKNNNERVTINETDIAWSTDIKTKFKLQKEKADRQWLNVTDEHFIVWARNSGLSNFRKLWGRIEKESNGLDKGILKAGDYTLSIRNSYNVTKFGGSKKIILSTVAIFGGKNHFVWTAYLFCGAMCIIIAFIFKGKQYMDPENFKEYEKIDEQEDLK